VAFGKNSGNDHVTVVLHCCASHVIASPGFCRVTVLNFALKEKCCNYQSEINVIKQEESLENIVAETFDNFDVPRVSIGNIVWKNSLSRTRNCFQTNPESRYFVLQV
jgi:hypothetical protein